MPGDDEPKGSPPLDSIASAVENARPIGTAPAEPAAEAKGGKPAKPAGGTRKAAAGKAAGKVGGRKPLRRPSDGDGDENRPPKRERRPPQRDSIMGLVEHCAFWADPDGEAFVTFERGDHFENHAVRSDVFKRWLSAEAYGAMGVVPGAQGIEDVLRVLEAKAATEGRTCAPWLRVGARGGRVYLDLGDDAWRAVEIAPNGWKVVSGRDLPFVRYRGARALPEPEGGESIDLLRPFVNTEAEADFRLAVAWLVAALRPAGPFPILAVNGQQGTGKSTFSRLLRSLVDPNIAAIRSTPKDDRDLVISAKNAHALVYDNLSKVDPWFGDALCRIATGSGFATRKLMSDADETLFMAARPVILNGIPSLTDRADLADRTVTVRLAVINERERRDEETFWSDWEAVRPRVLGALLDGVSAALRNIAAVRLDRVPRMADFARWMAAAEPGLGWEPGAFARSYGDNRREVAEHAYEADPIAMAIVAHMKGRSTAWEGTATELLGILNDLTTESVRRMRTWPATAQGLGNRLERAAPLLRERGLVVERKHSGTRTIIIAPTLTGEA